MISSTIREHGSRAALPVVLGTRALVAINVAIVNIALVDIQRQLGFDPASLSWVVNAYLLAYGGLLVVGGRLGDVIGRRRIMLIGLVVFLAAVAVAAFATVPAILIGARAVQGAGAALAAPAVLAVISHLYDGQHRARALGWFSVVNGVGLSAGMVLGGVVVQWLDWRWIFILDIPAALALLILTAIFVPKLAPRSRSRLDLLGAALATVTAVAAVYGFVGLAASEGNPVVWIASFVVALVALVWLVAHLRRFADPLIPIRIFADRQRVGAFIANGLSGAAITGFIFFVSQFLSSGLGLAPIGVGAAFLLFTIPQIPVSLAVPRFVQRFGTGPVARASLTSVIVGLLLLAPLAGYSGFAAPVWIGMILIGLGVGGVYFAINTTIMSTVEADIAGGASGMLQMSLQLGGSIGVAVLVLGNAVGGVGLVMVTAAVFEAVAMVLMSLRPGPTGRPTPSSIPGPGRSATSRT